MQEGARLRVLVVTPPGRWRDGLQAVVRASHLVGVVDEADDTQSALAMIAAHPPALVLLDTDLPDGRCREILMQIRNKWPHVLIVLLVNNSRERSAAVRAGADAALVRDITTSTFGQLLADLASLGSACPQVGPR